MAIQLKLLVIIVFLVVGNIIWAEDNSTKFDGNYHSKHIRELWQVCSFTFQAKQPQVPQPLRWEICDCYVDVIRESMTPEDALKASPEQNKKLAEDLINKCNGKLNNKPPIMT